MHTKFKIGIVGVGMVGAPLARYCTTVKGYKRSKTLFLFDTDTRKGFRDDISKADIIFIAVPTPRSTNGSADISILTSAIASIEGRKTIVIKSTVPPGTTEKLAKQYPRHTFFFNPEFLTEKNAWNDFIRTSRQIVGFTGRNIATAKIILSLLPQAPFMSPSRHGGKVIAMTATEAELVKYATNVYLARRVNFANALARASEKLKANYDHVRAGLAADPRIGASHLDVAHGGYRGFGGYCLPKDLDAFIASLKTLGLANEAGLFREDWKFNEKLLASQGLTIDDVSVHDHEWIKKKLKS